MTMSADARSQIADEAGLLSQNEMPRLEAAAARFSRTTGVELRVLVVKSVPGRDFRAHAMAERRRRGGDEPRNIILVVSVEDRHAEVATSPSLARVFTRASTSALLQRSMSPLMRQNRPADAILATISAFEELLRRSPRRGWGWALAALAAIAMVITGVCGYGYVQDHRCSRCRGWGQVRTAVLREATYTSEGQKEVRFLCPKCGWEHAEMRTIPTISSRDSSSDSSGSDSGGGGGDSGGGSDGGGGGDW